MPAQTKDNADPASSPREDLAQMISAYNQVTERMQQSHETLQQEVLRLRQELASTNAQLQRSKRLSALGEMAAGIAHEIRNPLAAIQLYANMVLDDLPASKQVSQEDNSPHALDASAVDEPTRSKLDQSEAGSRPAIDSARDSTEKIASAVDRLTGIVSDVLSFARQLEPDPRSLNLPEVFDRLVSAHRPAIDAAGVEIEIDLDRRPAPSLFADPDSLHQALLNLVRNAVDAMADQRETPPRLTLTARALDDGSTAIRVRDSGPGIDQQHADRLFNPFFTTRNTGTGLGLAIVHRIVDAHGGSIALWNDRGAVFEMTFPPDRTVEIEQTERESYEELAA